MSPACHLILANLTLLLSLDLVIFQANNESYFDISKSQMLMVPLPRVSINKLHCCQCVARLGTIAQANVNSLDYLQYINMSFLCSQS